MRANIVACALLIAGCAAPDREPVDEAPSGIVHGSDTTAAHNAVVSLSSHVGLCSGTLVAPNLVLTARHCVSERPKDIYPGVSCDLDGDPVDVNGVVVPGEADCGVDIAPDDIELRMLDANLDSAPNNAPNARGRRLFHSPDRSLCHGDFALVALDRDVDDPVIAPLRLAAPPAVGETVTAVGFGAVAPGDEPAHTRSELELTVLAVGPASAAFKYDVDVPPRFFSVGGGLCFGDSGSPALAASGAAIGVA